ncbi:hypothetical protein [uncultured Lacinutrix sp.]|nr:hypothetical protein [uncultured Lacinutrix sp.]
MRIELYIEPKGTPDIRMIDQFQWWKIQGIMPNEIKKRVEKF